MCVCVCTRACFSNPKSQSQTPSHNYLACPNTQFKVSSTTALHSGSSIGTTPEALGKHKASKNAGSRPVGCTPAKSTSLLRPKSYGSAPPTTRPSSSIPADFLHRIDGQRRAQLPSLPPYPHRQNKP